MQRVALRNQQGSGEGRELGSNSRFNGSSSGMPESCSGPEGLCLKKNLLTSLIAAKSRELKRGTKQPSTIQYDRSRKFYIHPKKINFIFRANKYFGIPGVYLL